MATYIFPVQNVTAHEGYTTLTIIDGLAEVDENNPDQVKLAKAMSGEKEKPRTVKKVKRGKK